MRPTWQSAPCAGTADENLLPGERIATGFALAMTGWLVCTEVLTSALILHFAFCILHFYRPSTCSLISLPSCSSWRRAGKSLSAMAVR